VSDIAPTGEFRKLQKPEAEEITRRQRLGAMVS
jgi:hypothetical protein